MPIKIQSSPHSLSEYLEAIAHQRDEFLKIDKSDLIFRGQESDYPLIPKIARLKPKGKLLNIEQLMINEFSRQYLPFAEFEPKDRWDMLALAQHHGLPTRLLDWSTSALAALWFCVRNAPKRIEKDKNLSGTVWIFKTNPKDFRMTESPFAKGKTRIFRPRLVSRRILAQNGLFTCHKPTSKGHFLPLEKNPLYQDRLAKIEINHVQFSNLREELIASGVSSVALFPDLDGLAAHLERRYFHDPQSAY